MNDSSIYYPIASSDWDRSVIPKLERTASFRNVQRPNFSMHATGRTDVANTPGDRPGQPRGRRKSKRPSTFRKLIEDPRNAGTRAHHETSCMKSRIRPRRRSSSVQSISLSPAINLSEIGARYHRRTLEAPRPTTSAAAGGALRPTAAWLAPSGCFTRRSRDRPGAARLTSSLGGAGACAAGVAGRRGALSPHSSSSAPTGARTKSHCTRLRSDVPRTSSDRISRPVTSVTVTRTSLGRLHSSTNS